MSASTGLGRGVAAAGLLLVSWVAPAAVHAQGPPAGPVFQVHIGHEATAGAVRRSLEGAFERLGSPACQGLFGEFRDLAGRPLQHVLDGLDQTGQGYLGLVIFYDGARHPRCQVGGNLAVASPGTRVVYVCPEQFRSAARRDPALAEWTVIHEMLHSLGLGENPPRSWEITARVGKLCRQRGR